MVVQLDILQAIEERNKGIEKAENTADSIDPNWREEAFELVKEFIRECPGEFMVEQVRAYAAIKDFVAPASNRIWGPIIRRAAKEGLVMKIKLGTTSNPFAHRANAGVWLPVKQAS